MARHKVTYRYDDETHDGGWLAECPELGAFTEGNSLREARRMVRDAVELALDSSDFELAVRALVRASDGFVVFFFKQKTAYEI